MLWLLYYLLLCLIFFFFNDTATTEIYTLSLHDALPISLVEACGSASLDFSHLDSIAPRAEDRKSTRLNSSHVSISYAVFCLKKKNNTTTFPPTITTILSHYNSSHTTIPTTTVRH